MFKKISCALALVIGSVVAVNAQQTITFDSDNPGYKKKKKKEVKMNSATLGILSTFNGYLPVYFERKVTDFLSLQAGVGLTFRSIGNDMGQMLYEEGSNSDYVESFYGTSVAGLYVSDVQDVYENYQYRNARPGYCLSFAPRVYFNDNVMDGFFLAPEVSYKLYRYGAQLANTTIAGANAYSYDDELVPRVTKMMNEYMACMDYTLAIGGHYQKSNSMAVSWSISAGLRKFKAERLDVYVVNDVTSSSGGHFQNIGRQYDGLKPLLHFNLAIGGVF